MAVQRVSVNKREMKHNSGTQVQGAYQRPEPKVAPDEKELEPHEIKYLSNMKFYF